MSIPLRIEMSPMQRALFLFLLTALLISPLWATSRIIGLAPFLAGALVAAVIALLPPEGERAPAVPISGPGLGESAMVTTLILLPAALFLGLTWNQEFPFVGDHDYHLLQSEIAARFWSRYFIPVVALIGAFAVATRKRIAAPWLIAPFVAVPLLGLMVEGDFFFAARYPGVFYFIAAPFRWISAAAGLDSPLNALRVANFASLPVWLLVLRPLLLRRWPERSLLPFGLFFYWQKDVVYYVTASYLEPWSLVLVLTAVERFLRSDDESAWVEYLLIGAAAVIKEQSVLLLPFLFVATWGKARGNQRRNLLVAAIVAGFPFIVYYLLRTALGVWRTAGPAGWNEISDPSRLLTLFDRASVQFGPTLVVLAGCAIGLLVASVIARERRVRLFTLFIAALFQVVFFYADSISVAWTGYPRFHLLPDLLIGGGFLLWLAARNRSWAIVLAVLVGAVNLIGLVPELRSTRRPDIERNFVEHRDSPVYFPAREILADAERAGLSHETRRVRLVSNVDRIAPRYSLYAFPQAYPEIARRYAIDVLKPAPTPDCRCADAAAILGLYVYYTNLGAQLDARHESAEFARACDDQIERTCSRMLRIERRGQRVATLGAGVRP